MASVADARILEVVEATTRIVFDGGGLAEERLCLQARMKGRGIKKPTGLRRPEVPGALLDILLRCVDITEMNGEIQRGYYNRQLTK
jgi:hypothetical protein